MISTLSMQEITLFEEIWRIIVKKFFTADLGVYENINIDPESAISPAVIVFAVFIAAVTATAVMIFNKGTLGRLVRRLIKEGGVGHDNAKTLAQLGLDDSRIIKFFINRYTLSRYVRCREEDEFYGIDPSQCDEDVSSIGIENNDVIKVPFWRRKADAKMREEACATRDSEENICVASDECEANQTCDTDVNATQDEAEITEGRGEENIVAASDDETVFEDSYAASLVADKKYKRKPTDHFYIRPSQKHRLLVRFDKKGTNPVWIFIVGAICLVGGSLVIKALPWLLETLDGLLGTFNTNNKY